MHTYVPPVTLCILIWLSSCNSHPDTMLDTPLRPVVVSLIIIYTIGDVAAILTVSMHDDYVWTTVTPASGSNTDT